MLHPGDFEFFGMPYIADWTYDEFWSNFGMPLVDEWKPPTPPPNDVHFLNDNNKDVMFPVDPAIKRRIEMEALPMTGVYHCFKEHSYSNASVSILDRDFLDPLSSDDCMPPDTTPTPHRRRNAGRMAKVAKSVSINIAANNALNFPQRIEPPKKRRKIDNSVETTPSSSDYEDARSRHRPAKCTAIRAIGFNSNAKAGKSEVQRTNHNRNEKKRREVMSNMMKKVRFLVPAEFYRERTEKARAKASKQKILVACKAYIHHLKETEAKNANILKTEKKQVQIINRRLIKKWEQLKCQLNALSC